MESNKMVAFKSKMINVMSIISGCLGMIVWIYLIVIRPTYIPSYIFWFMAGFFCTFYALIFGAVSIVKLVRKRANVVLHTIGFIACVISILMMIYSVYFIAIPQIKISQRGAKMADIGIALQLYLGDHSGQLPDSSFWCDALVKDGFVKEKNLTIISKDGSRRNYSMNANVFKNAEMPNDMVLIFESVYGWNLVGDRNLLVGDDCKGGSWILFKDFSSRYVYPYEFENLRWENKMVSDTIFDRGKE